jgi:hypothetical protein
MPMIDYKEYRPRNFQPDTYDIGKIYHLNKWLMENSPAEDKTIYKQRSELLDNEMNYNNFKIFQRRFFIFMAGVIYYYIFHFDEMQENRDFARLVDMKREE